MHSVPSIGEKQYSVEQGAKCCNQRHIEPAMARTTHGGGRYITRPPPRPPCLVVHPTVDGAAGRSFAVQTLARFGDDSVCHGVSVDSTGSVYLGVSESSDSKEGNIVVVEAANSRALQLPITVPGLKCVAVSPDGSELYVGCKDGRVLCYKQPWSQPTCEQVMHLEGAEIKHMVAGSDCLWVLDTAGKLSQVKPSATTVDITGTGWKYPVPGVTPDGTQVLYCTQPSVGPSRIDPATGAVTPVPIRWPDAQAHAAVGKQVLGCNSRGALLVATSPSDEDHYTRLYHVAPDGTATLVLAQGAPPQGSICSREEDEEEDSSSSRDIWEGCTWTDGSALNLQQYTLDPDGSIVGFTASGALVRITLPSPVCPAHLQRFSGSNPVHPSFTKDWANLLASGEGADVQLRCAEGAVVKAHSHVLLARCEYYRLLQRNVEAGMSGSAGEVDVSEHSETTMQLVLEYLYTGSVQLSELLLHATNTSASGAEQAAGPSAAAGQSAETPTSKQSRKRDADGALKQADALHAAIASTSHADPVASAPVGQGLQQVTSLMRAADALLLPDLCYACLRLVQRQLAPETALPLLLAAHEAQIEVLQTAVMAFVVRSIRAIRGCKTSPITIEDVVTAAPELGAKLAAAMALAM